jgi:hypothetical protein
LLTASTLHTPLRDEMFRGRVTPLSRTGLRSRGLREPQLRPEHGHPARHSMFKTHEMEDFPSRPGGTLADNRPVPFDAKSGQMFWLNRKFARDRSGLSERTVGIALLPTCIPDSIHIVGAMPPSITYSAPVIEPARDATSKANCAGSNGRITRAMLSA